MGESIKVRDGLDRAARSENLASSALLGGAQDRRAWHALYTRHQHEKVTATILANKGFEIFLPLYTVAHRWKDRTKNLSLPLFPCYVFLRGGLDRWVDILSTPGVHSLVRLGEQAAVVSEQEIQAVRRAVESNVRAEPHPFLRCGDRVRITSGPLAGIEGILVRKKDQFRLVLSVELLHRSIAVEIEGTALELLHREDKWAENRPSFGSPAYACPSGG